MTKKVRTANYEIGSGARARLEFGGSTIPVAVNTVGGKLLLAVRMSDRPRFRVGNTIRLSGSCAGMFRAGQEPPEDTEFTIAAETGSSVRGMRQFVLVRTQKNGGPEPA